MYQFPSSGVTINPTPVIIPESKSSQDLSRFLYQKKMDKQRLGRTFANDLTIDDIEGVPQDLLDKQAARKQQYEKKWTQRYKDSGGKLSTQDYLEIAKDKNSMLQEQKKWLMSQKWWGSQVALYKGDPSKWDPASEEALKHFDENDPNKSYLTPYVPTPEQTLAELKKMRPENRSVEGYTKNAKGETITTTTRNNDLYTPENIQNTMINDYNTSGSYQHWAVKNLAEHSADFKDTISQIEKAQQDPNYVKDDFGKDASDLAMAKEFTNRYGGPDGAQQYFLDTQRKMYENERSVSVETKPAPKDPADKDKRDVIKMEEIAMPDGTMKRIWPTNSKPPAYYGTPSVVYDPNTEEPIVSLEGPTGKTTPITEAINGGKIIQAYQSPKTGKMFAVLQYQEKVKTEASSSTSGKGSINIFPSGSETAPKTVLIPWEDLSQELKRELNYENIDAYAKAKTKDPSLKNNFLN